MSEYTPTTADARGKYATHQGARYRGQKYLDRRRAEFDRWLEQVKAEAWDEGNEAGWTEANAHHENADTYPKLTITNPYRQERAT